MEDKNVPPSYPGYESTYSQNQQAYQQSQPGYPQSQPGYPQSQPGYPQPNYPYNQQQGYMPQAQPSIIVQPNNTPIIIGGGCPSCRVGKRLIPELLMKSLFKKSTCLILILFCKKVF